MGLGGPSSDWDSGRSGGDLWGHDDRRVARPGRPAARTLERWRRDRNARREHLPLPSLRSAARRRRLQVRRVRDTPGRGRPGAQGEWLRRARPRRGTRHRRRGRRCIHPRPWGDQCFGGRAAGRRRSVRRRRPEQRPGHERSATTERDARRSGRPDCRADGTAPIDDRQPAPADRRRPAGKGAGCARPVTGRDRAAAP